MHLTRSIFFIVMLLIGTKVQAQIHFQAPDYQVIKKYTRDKQSPYYYPKLFAMYNNDSALSLKDYRMLYYGYYFQKEYAPYGKDPHNVLKKLNRLYDKKDYKKSDLNKAIKFLLAYLEANPFDTRKLYDVYSAYNLLGDSVSGVPYAKKALGIGKAIFSTGDGLTKKTAYHVMNVSAEYFILFALDYEYNGDRLLTEEWCDYLEVKENDEGVKGVYFDVTRLRMASNRLDTR